MCARGIIAVGVGLLHADVDGAHERAVAEALTAAIPGVEVSLSSEINPQYREYERFSTTIVNAALSPIMRSYLERVGPISAGTDPGPACYGAARRRVPDPRG